MEERHYKKKSLLIVCNILLTLLLILTTAVTITLAVQQFNMNIGGDITFNATDVQATISAGQISNGTVADSTNKMQQIVLTPENDGALEKATWEGLEITFNGLDDVIISFTVTNNHTESNLEMTLVTSYTQITNMTISTRINNSSKTSVIIPKQAEGNDNQVECEIIFHIESNLTSASIEGFSIEYAFENTEEEPTYAVSIDPSSSDMVTGVSLNNATAGQQVIVTANISDTVTEDYVIMSDGPLYYIENGSEEKVTINQTEGQYSFTMPANDITIGIETYRRLDDFTFDGNSITDYTGSDSELTLPAYYETVDVNSQNYTIEKDTGTEITEIGEFAFQDCTSLSSIVIPREILEIGKGAFYNCTNLQKVDFSKNSQLEIIDQGIFNKTGITSITIPASVTSIGSYAFEGCDSLQTVDFGNNSQLQTIGEYAFQDCTNLTSITIPSSVTSIGDMAFAGCRSLTSITVPSSLVSIGTHTFDACTALAIVINKSNDIIISKEDPFSCGFLGFYAYEVLNAGEEAQGRIEEINNVNYYVNGTTKVALCVMNGSVSSITLEDDTTAINQGAFFGRTNLTVITIPASVTSIGNSAFYNCSSLQTVDFGDNSQLQTIGERAFDGCTKLASITIPENVTSIGNSAFYNCSSLQTVDFGDNSQLQTIGSSAFSRCTNLTSITIPANVTSIGNDTFYRCDNLTSVTIESDDIYNAAIGTNTWSHAGGLLANAMTVKVLKTIVDTCDNSYLENSSNFTTSKEGEYTVFTKKV